VPSLCSGFPSKILQIFPHQDYLPSVGDPGGGENDKKGEAGSFIPKTNGCAISKCIVHSKIEASFIFLLPLHFLTPFSFGH
jgi:hypothetical protein